MNFSLVAAFAKGTVIWWVIYISITLADRFLPSWVGTILAVSVAAWFTSEFITLFLHEEE